MTIDEIIERMGEDFPAGDINTEALNEMRNRLLMAARARRLLSYSELVSGIPIIHNTFWPEPHFVDIHDWSGLDRQMIGGVLARFSVESLRQNGFFIGCLVVDKGEAKPSDILFQWLYEIGLLTSLNDDTVLAFWADNVRRIHQYYAQS